MRRWLRDFNEEALQPHGITCKAFTFGQTNANGDRDIDDSMALSTLVFALNEQEATILQLEPVLQRGHPSSSASPAARSPAIAMPHLPRIGRSTASRDPQTFWCASLAQGAHGELQPRPATGAADSLPVPRTIGLVPEPSLH